MSYLSPKTLDEAFAALEAEGVSVIAGGTDWFPQAGERLTDRPMLDVTRLPGFRGISRTEGGWRIGAATTWAEIARADLPPCFDGLQAAAREVGSVQIQNSGTIAGNLCNASPAADGVPPLLTLNASVELVSKGKSRTLPLSDFITGPRRTALGSKELLASLHLPDCPGSSRSGFLKLGSRRYLVISIAMVAALIRIQAGRVAEARIAVGACSAVAQRLPLLESRLTGHRVTAKLPQVDADCLSTLTPISDIRGSGDYRGEAVAEMLDRLITDLMRQGGGEDE